MKILYVIFFAFIFIGSGLVILINELQKPLSSVEFDLSEYNATNGPDSNLTLTCKESPDLIKIKGTIIQMKNKKGESLFFYKDDKNYYLINDKNYICSTSSSK